jgi:hypothetical protein
MASLKIFRGVGGPVKWASFLLAVFGWMLVVSDGSSMEGFEILSYWYCAVGTPVILWASLTKQSIGVTQEQQENGPLYLLFRYFLFLIFAFSLFLVNFVALLKITTASLYLLTGGSHGRGPIGFWLLVIFWLGFSAAAQVWRDIDWRFDRN